MFDNPVVITTLVGFVGSMIGLLIGKRLEKAKANNAELNNVKMANDMVFPLLESGKRLSEQVDEIRREKEESDRKQTTKINELEKSINEYIRLASQCTCGIFQKDAPDRFS